MSDLGLCDCCRDGPAIGVAAVPGLPISIAWCRRCLEADVIPYSLLVANTAMIGGVDDGAAWWQATVKRTLKYFSKPRDEFLADVAKEIAEAPRDPQEMEIEDGVE